MSDNGQQENMPDSKQTARSPRGPKCEACGATIVLKDYRPHPTLKNHELRTYACPQCSRAEVLSSPMPSLD